MASKNVQVVVPRKLKHDKYSEYLNVISFEDFIEDHLDPGVERWKKRGIL